MTEDVSPKTFKGKRSGVVYGVYTSDNPHRCRYVGVTIQGLHRRAQGHWFQARKGAESRIARFLRETPDAVFRAGASERMKSYWATGVINVRGEDKPSAKLTEEDVRAIRSSFTGAYGDKTALAREYKVALSTISSIINRETWEHV